MANSIRILLTNDDGYEASGIRALHDALLAAGHSVVRVAPEGERSALSHSITMKDALRVKRLKGGQEIYSISGTPADCVKIGLLELCPDAEFVLSGINYGHNAGVATIYSATVAAAREGMLMGRRAMAISRARAPGDPYVHDSAACALTVLDYFLEYPMPKGAMINLNYPARPLAECRGIKRATISGTYIMDSYVRCVSDRLGEDWYVMDLDNYIDRNPEPGSDTYLLREGFATYTCMGWDSTLAANDALPDDLKRR